MHTALLLALRKAHVVVSYLDPSHSELSQGSTHLGGSCIQVFSTGDDFYQQ